MYAVEFEAPIENGIVHIPQEYQDIQQTQKAKIIIIYDNMNNKNITNSNLEEFRNLRKKSNNKKQANMNLVNNIDGLIDDGIF